MSIVIGKCMHTSPKGKEDIFFGRSPLITLGAGNFPLTTQI